MTKQKRNFLDDIDEGARRLWDEIDRFFNPSKRPKPARVPARVRPSYPPQAPRKPSSQ